MERLRREFLAGLPIVVGGRSSGARVACRTAELTDAAGVLCLAFPLVPPRRAGRTEAPSRLPELEGVGVPVLVLQGERDPFGRPPPAVGRSVVVVPGDHALRAGLPAIAAATLAWLGDLVASDRD
jgi:predicted alpha/beta-hydrolase family hydrolase